jgi:hypothetical protein
LALHCIDQSDECKRRAGGGKDVYRKRAGMDERRQDILRSDAGLPAGPSRARMTGAFHHTIPCCVVMATPAIIG